MSTGAPRTLGSAAPVASNKVRCAVDANHHGDWPRNRDQLDLDLAGSHDSRGDVHQNDCALLRWSAMETSGSWSSCRDGLMLARRGGLGPTLDLSARQDDGAATKQATHGSPNWTTGDQKASACVGAVRNHAPTSRAESNEVESS